MLSEHPESWLESSKVDRLNIFNKAARVGTATSQLWRVAHKILIDYIQVFTILLYLNNCRVACGVLNIEIEWMMELIAINLMSFQSIFDFCYLVNIINSIFNFDLGLQICSFVLYQYLLLIEDLFIVFQGVNSWSNLRRWYMPWLIRSLHLIPHGCQCRHYLQVWCINYRESFDIHFFNLRVANVLMGIFQVWYVLNLRVI